jgi:hypothetical protein
MPTSVLTVASVLNALVKNTLKTTVSRQAEFVTTLPVTRSDAAANRRPETTPVHNTELKVMESVRCPKTVSNTNVEVMEPLPACSVGAPGVRGLTTITTVRSQRRHHNIMNKVVVQALVEEVN